MIQVNDPITTARIQKAEGRMRSMTAPETIEAAVQENSRNAAQNTPLMRAQKPLPSHAVAHGRAVIAPAPPRWVPISSLHGTALARSSQAAGDARAVGEGEVDPPAEEEERDGHQRDQHGVLHQRVQVVLVAGDADFVHAEADVDEEHDRHRHPVVELGENHR